MRFEFDSGGPSVVEAWIPVVNASGSSNTPWQPDHMNKSMDKAVEQYLLQQNGGGGNSNSNSNDPNYSRLLMLRNKKPKWDSAHGGHVLNFLVRTSYMCYCIVICSYCACSELSVLVYLCVHTVIVYL